MAYLWRLDLRICRNKMHFFLLQFVDMHKIVHPIIVVFFSPLFVMPVFAQVETVDALSKQFDVAGQESTEWIPNLLQSSYAGLREMAQYNGFALNWIPRGFVQVKGNTINGIDWSSNLSGWDPGLSYAGLYGGIKKQAAASAYGMSAFGLSGRAGNDHSSTEASLFTKNKSLTSRLSDASTMQTYSIQWHSGRIKKSIWMNIDAIYQTTPTGFLANGWKERKGILFSVEKSFADKHQLGFSCWWSPVQQGKRAPTVQELYSMTKDPLYNPSWGWLNGQAVYANTKKSNVPVVSLHYTYRTPKGNAIQLHLGGVFGAQSTTQLDWANAADPRPDYYKYLPSFAMDEALKKSLTNWHALHPELLQIQFDQLVAKNRASANGAAKYIINERMQQLQLLRVAMRANIAIGANNYWYTGLTLHADKIEYNNRLADLLGGQFYYNYNTWVNDDGLATAFQNDILAPDRKIKVGENWGAHYMLFNKSVHAWTTMIGATRFLEWGMGIQIGLDQMQRNGINQNGLFPMLSKGLAEPVVFPASQYQCFLRYKFNGRWYLTTHLFLAMDAPEAAEVYMDPSNHAVKNPFLLPLMQRGAEVKLQFMGSNVKVYAAFFWQFNQHERQYKMFYHDFYNAFVRASVGQIQTLHQGMETFIETNWSSPFQLSIANSYGWYQITNHPLYEIRLSDNLYKVQSGQLLLKQFPATAYPQAVQAISLNYQPNFALRFSYSIVFASRRAISHDLFRRSNWTKENVPGKLIWEKLSAPVWAPDQWVSNLSLSKSFQVKSSNQNFSIRFTASVRNLLNASIPSLIFEQSRFDYNHFLADKFPAKYLYDLGRTYNIGMQLSTR